MKKIPCYAGAIQALSSYLYDPVSKSVIEFDEYGGVSKVEKIWMHPTQLFNDLDAMYRKHGKPRSIEEDKLKNLYQEFEKLEISKRTVNGLAKKLFSEIK